TGTAGATNGAAMLIAPVGIATPLERLLAAVVDADRVTHDTPIAHAGAAVVATVVSAGVDGAGFSEATPLAIEAASHFGFGELFEDAMGKGSLGTGVEAAEAVPTAFSIASRWPKDAWAARERAVRRSRARRAGARGNRHGVASRSAIGHRLDDRDDRTRWRADLRHRDRGGCDRRVVGIGNHRLRQRRRGLRVGL